MCKSLILSFLMLLLALPAYSQQISLDTSYTAQQLAETIMDVNCEVQITNATITGYNGIEGTSYGHYSFNDQIMEDSPLQNGIMLSSGYDIDEYRNIWFFDYVSTGDTSWPGDIDISNAIGSNTSYNATVLEFDFVPSVNYISFTFTMGSSEYYSYATDVTRGCSYNDGIAILIKPADNSQPYQNLALIPNTTLPICMGNLYYNVLCLENGYNYAALYNNNNGVVTTGIAVTPGTLYHLKIGISDGRDAGYDSNVIIGAIDPDYSINLGVDRLHEFLDPLCDGEVVTVSSKPGAVQYKWYKDGVLISGETAIAYTITQPGVFTSVATMPNGCDYTGEIIIEYNAPISQTPLTYYQCDEDGDGFSAYYIPLMGQEVLPPGLQPIYYYHALADANANINPIIIPSTPQLYYNIVPNEQVYVRAQNAYGCQQIIPIILSVTPPVNPVFAPVTGCTDENAPAGFATFDLAQASIDLVQPFPPGTTAQFFLSEAEALLGLLPLPQQYTNITAGGDTLYIRLSNNTGCYGIAPIQLVVQDFGADFFDESVALCQDTSLTLNAGSGFVSYIWQGTPVQTTPAITVNEPGNYDVTVTNNAGCSRTKTFTVFDSAAAHGASFSINDFMGGRNSVTIAAQGIGVYEYSLDGSTYQDSPDFDGLPAGEYTAYIRDINGCGLYTDTFYILDYPTFFSPDGDGLNDTWRIPYMQTRPKVVVTVFDRYGKLITAFSGISPGWDGTLNGTGLPATDYWFILTLENGRVVKGHFSLLR
jgi:gliding motility-associated-like protein